MAYISQEMKKKLLPGIKEVFKKYKVKGSVGINNYSTLAVTITSGELDFLGADLKIQLRQAIWDNRSNSAVKSYLRINRFAIVENCRLVQENNIADFFEALIKAMEGDLWYDRSDIMTDYFDTAYYLSINVGKWDKPYILTLN